MQASLPTSKREHRIIALFACLLIANPIVVYLMTRQPVLTAALTIGCVLFGQALLTPKIPAVIRAYSFNAVAVLSAFAHAEVLLVYGFPDRVTPNLYEIRDGYYFNTPLLQPQFESDEFSVTYRTNSQGFRIGSGQEPAHSIDRADWLVLGDSFTQGAQVEFEHLYSTRLNVRFPDKIVVNAGISGMGVAQEYEYFVDAGRLLEPSLVILQVGSFNDFMNVSPRRAGLSEWLMTKSAFVRLLLSDLKYRDPSDLPLGRWTEPFYDSEAANRDFNIFYRLSSDTKERDLAQFANYLRRLNAAVVQQGGRFLVVLLPTREQADELSLEEVLTAFRIDSSRIDLRRPNDILLKLAESEGIAFVDLLPAFTSARSKLFFDGDEHLTPEGHALIADTIGDYLEQRDGPSKAAMLSRDLSGDRYPVMSQDGSLVAYQSIREGSSDLFIADPQFRDRRRLTTTRVDESHPMLSKDNRRVLFTEGSAEAMRTEIVIADIDDGRRTVITGDPNVFGAIPVFSPSNIRVAYAEWSFRGSDATLPRIAVFDLTTGEKSYLTRTDQESWRPIFSPDERRLAYIAKSNGQFDVYVHDFGTGQATRLTNTEFDEWDPQFTPDGARLVFAAKEDGNWDLFAYDLESRGCERLTKTKGDEWDPSVSSDGRELLFAGRFGSLEAIFKMPLPPRGSRWHSTH